MRSGIFLLYEKSIQLRQKRPYRFRRRTMVDASGRFSSRGTPQPFPMPRLTTMRVGPKRYSPEV